MKNSYFWFLATVSFVGCFALGVWLARTDARESTLASSNGCREPLTDADLSIRGVQNFALRNNIRSVDELLPCLPPEMQKNYALVHHSGSPQPSSPTQPRVLMIATNPHPKVSSRRRTKFVGTFGSPHAAGVVDPLSDSFEMAEIDPRKPIGARLDFGRLDFSVSPPMIHKQECLMCHGPTARFVIDSYPVWGGFYGEKEFHCNPQEQTWFRDFVRQIPGSRYQWLEGLDNFWGHFGDDPEKRCTVVHNQQFHDGLIFEINDRIAKLVRQTPHYREYKYALFGAALECPQLKDFLPARLRGDHMQTRYLLPELQRRDDQAVLKRLLSALVKMGSKPDRSDTMAKIFRKKMAESPENIYMIDTLIRADREAGNNFGSTPGLRYLIEGRGISMKEWFADRDFARYSDASGDQNGFEIANALEDADRELAAFSFASPLEISRGIDSKYRRERLPQICPILKKRSLAALVNLRPVGAQVIATAPYPQAFRKCQQCHNGVGEAPEISFGNQKALELELPINLLARKMAYRVRKDAGPVVMPPEREHNALNDLERQQIWNYLRSLGYDTPDQIR